MFMVAIHLLFKKKKNDKLELPVNVPPSLIQSSGFIAN
jgi:hypothetical protein